MAGGPDIARIVKNRYIYNIIKTIKFICKKDRYINAVFAVM